MKSIEFNAEDLINTVEDTRDVIDRAKRSIAIEDLATVFLSEFAKMNKHLFTDYDGVFGDCDRKTFLKMNYAARRKLVEKVLDKMEIGV